MSLKDINPLFLTDYYKTVHHLAYVPGMEYLASYWTPRMSRIEGVDKVVMFGLQAVIKEYLIDMFQSNFFDKDFAEIDAGYKRVIGSTMTAQAAETSHIKALHDLGYLPIKILAVPEGMRVNIKTPMFQVINTVAGFGWLTNYLETTISHVFNAMTTATIAYEVRKLVEEFYDKTVCLGPESGACGDFSMRGMTSPVSSMASSAGHLLSFKGSATIAANLWLEEYYNCRCDKEIVALGTPSMEHSVMCSYEREGEFGAYKHLIENVFPEGPLSIVSDTYDYWTVLTDFLPKLKDSIMKRNGKVIIRGDSGDPVDIICGTFGKQSGEIIEEYPELEYRGIRKFFKEKASKDFKWQEESYREYYIRIKGGKTYTVKCHYTWVNDDESSMGGYTSNTVGEIEITPLVLTPEQKGTVELLWEVGGGCINEKGYKVLDPHWGAIYGDGMTYERILQSYTRLEKKGYAVNNVTMGIGSFTYQYITRDTFGFALKATHCVVNGEERQIYKDPITDKAAGNNFKKSQRGMCYVYQDGEDILYKDGLTLEDLKKPEYQDNLLLTVFEDGKIVKEYSLAEIRNRLHHNNF